MPFSECHSAIPQMSRLFYIAVAVSASVFFADPAQAQMRLDETCVFDEGRDDSCAHVVACIGGDTLFVGGGVGWNSGTVRGELYIGKQCTGTWDNATGKATVDCGDGLEGAVQYTLIDGETGTAVGAGAMLDGRPIEVWSGANVAQYIERETGRATLQCGVGEVLMM